MAELKHGQGTVIRPCSCQNKYQDKTYGPGMRVHNVGVGKSGGQPPVKCTVCGLSKG